MIIVPQNLELGTSPAPSAATFDELRAAMPKASSDFIVAAQSAGMTLDDAKAKYTADLEEKVRQQAGVIKAIAGDEGLPHFANASATKPAKRYGSLSPALSRFAAGITFDTSNDEQKGI